MKEASPMRKKLHESGLAALVVMLLGTLVQAEGLAVPVEGGVVVLDGRSLAEVRRVELSGSGVPQLAIHPSSSVLAGLVGEQLVFWNLPALAEASKHKDSLFSGVNAMAFSVDGSSLFLLSPELRAVLKFDLATSKVTGTLPIPGGVPVWMRVVPDGVMIGQENAVSLLSPIPGKGLLAQYSFPDSIRSAAVNQGRILLARTGIAGVDSYELKTGRAIGFVPAADVVKDLVAGAGGLCALSRGGEVRALSSDAAQTRWVYPAESAPLQALISGGGGTVFCFDGKTGTLVSLDAVAGQENARISLSGTGTAVPVVVNGGF